MWETLNEAFALGAFARELAGAAHGFGALTRLLLGRLLEMRAAFHFAEKAFTLHLFLQRAKRLLDIIVADDDLYDGSISIGLGRLNPRIKGLNCFRKARLYHGALSLTTVYRMDASPSNRLKDAWLGALLPTVPFDGWTEAAAARAAEEAGLDEGEQALAAPGGLRDLIEHFFDRAEDEAKAAIEAADLDPLRVHERVALGVRAWLEALSPHKEAVRRAIQWGALPWRSGAPAQRAWSVADTVWTGIGDTSQDYNKYSKRGLLAAALPGIVMGWLDETDDEAIDALILARLKSAGRIGQASGKVLKPFLERFKRA